MAECRVQQIPLKEIFWPERERKHFGPEELGELAESIRGHGILEPLGVYRDGDRYVGLWGQRRFLAAPLAGLDSVPAIVREKPADDADAMEIRLIENVAREALRPIELASGLHQLMKASALSVSDAAKRLGMKPAAVTKAVALLKLSEPLRQQVDAGEISAAAGYELARVEDVQVRTKLAEQVASGLLSRDALAGKIKSIKREPNATNSAGRSRVTAKLSGGRLVTLCGNSLTVDSVIASLEELLTRCRSARTKGLGLGTLLKVLADEAKQIP
jgi:ParB family chromosome partitioning protein